MIIFFEVPMSKLTLDNERNIIKLWKSGCDIDSIKLLTGFRKHDIASLLMCTGLYGVDTLVRNYAESLYFNALYKEKKFDTSDGSVIDVLKFSDLPDDQKDYYMIKSRHVVKIRCESAYKRIMDEDSLDPIEGVEHATVVKDFRDRDSVTFNEIIRTEEEIKYLGFDIENNTIAEAEIVVTAHFGNTVGLHIYCKNVAIISGYQNTNNVGYMIKHLVEFFDVSEEDGLRFTEQFKDIPCRIVLDHDRCIGFGHVTRNAFVLRDDFVKVRD